MLNKFVNKYFTRVLRKRTLYNTEQNLVLFTPTCRVDQICGLHSFQRKKVADEYHKDGELFPEESRFHPKDAAAVLPGWKIKRYEKKTGASPVYNYIHPNGAKFVGLEKAYHFQLKYKAKENYQKNQENLPENFQLKNSDALLGDDWEVKQRKRKDRRGNNETE